MNLGPQQKVCGMARVGTVHGPQPGVLCGEAEGEVQLASRGSQTSTSPPATPGGPCKCSDAACPRLLTHCLPALSHTQPCTGVLMDSWLQP